MDCFAYRRRRAAENRDLIAHADERRSRFLAEIEAERAEYERTGIDPYHIDGIHLPE